MAKRKLPANFGPKDLSKLPPGLKAYWEKKRAGEKPAKKSGAPADEKPARDTNVPSKPKPAKKPASTKKTTKKSTNTTKVGVRKTTRTRLTGAKQKQTNKPKLEGASDPRVAQKLIDARK